MCSGNIACKSCARKSAVSGIGRRRRSHRNKSKSRINSLSMKKLNFKNFQPALEVAGGLFASNILNNLTVVQNNATVASIAKIGIGFFLGSKKGTVGNIANGLMAGGVIDLATKFIPSASPAALAGGLNGLLEPRQRPLIAGGHTRVGCAQEVTHTSVFA